MKLHQADVVIAGAGPAGLHTAYLLAKGGLSIIIVDQHPDNFTGARWVNGVPQWMLDEAGLSHTPSEEIFSQSHTFTMIDPSNKNRLSIKPFSVLDIDMRHLNHRLKNHAQRLDNIQFFYKTTLTKAEKNANERPISIAAEIKTNSKTEYASFKASLFVDASGLSGVIRKQIEHLKSLCPPPSREDLCLAAQEVRSIQDKEGAKSFLEKNKGIPGEILSWIGIEGGYSLLRVHIDEGFNHVAFLAGVRALPKHPSGINLIHRFIDDNEWVGSKIFGGQRAIPLRRPYPVLVAPGIALIGDAACQVYSVHGSGIGLGLIAARMLADAVLDAVKEKRDIGSLAALWHYTANFHRRFGALLNTADAFRRFSQTLVPNEIRRLLSSGLMSEGLTFDSLMQRPFKPRLNELPKQFFASFMYFDLVRKMAPVFAKIPILQTMPKFYPASFELYGKIHNYEAKLKRLIG